MANQQTNTPEEGAAIPIPLGGGDLFVAVEGWARPEELGDATVSRGDLTLSESARVALVERLESE